MIDAHCHLTYPGLKERAEEAVERARRVLDAVVTCGLPFEGEEPGRGYAAEEALRLAERHRGFVYVTLGFHPTQAPRVDWGYVERYMEFVERNAGSIVGIGEVGLDRYWLKEEEELAAARRVFEAMLGLAERLGKPVVIHSRKAEAEALEIVETYSVPRVLFHSYTGNMTTAKKILDRGYMFSVNYRVTNTKTMRKIARKFPLENILLETDSPFLSPTGGVNEPVNVRYVAEEVARLRGVPLEEVDRVTTLNAARFYGLPGWEGEG